MQDDMIHDNMTDVSSLKELPIGVQTFGDLINGGYVYVDKTEYLYRMVSVPRGVYFLSRPRRFGKSLLISTLEAIFLGKRDLFKGLFIDQTDYDWTPYPVLRFDFSKWGKTSTEPLVSFIKHSIQGQAEKYNVAVDIKESVGRCFDDAVRLIGQKSKVVILIDEYDKPILDWITNPEKASENREILKEFYTIIKAQDAYVRFVLLTGVSKFSKVSVFSGLNNLQDLTMTRQAAALCGYTQDELETNFKQRIAQLAESQCMTVSEILEKIKTWYNGYQFSSADVRVYNPFSTLLLFQHQEFKDYWFETGTPRFLVELVRQSSLPVQDLENRTVEEDAFSGFEIESLNSLSLLVQTGYLTIKHYNPDNRRYVLDYPNFEVKESFQKSLLKGFSGLTQPSSMYVVELETAIKNGDMEKLFDTLAVFFATIPYDIQLKKEKYYQSIFYLIFTILGFHIHAEVRTNKGRIDAVVETASHVYIFEFKLDDTAEAALAQIKTQDYYQRYQGSRKAVTLLGVSFDTTRREIVDWVLG